MSRWVYAPLVAIGIAAFAVAYRVAEPQQLVTETDNRDLLMGMATNMAAHNLPLTPTRTPIPTAIPTRRPKQPTDTPLPTYGAGVEPGLYIVERWTPTFFPTAIVGDGLPPCRTVTPGPYADIACTVGV